MKNLSIVFFFLMTFAFMSVNAQAQSSCQPKKGCKKVCTKTTKGATQTKSASNTFDFLNVNSKKEAKAKTGKKCCAGGATPGCCILPCSKKGAKATRTSVTSVSNKTSKESVTALKPKSN
jgi:hypothetical protein